jgi:hypothetical protein
VKNRTPEARGAAAKSRARTMTPSEKPPTEPGHSRPAVSANTRRYQMVRRGDKASHNSSGTTTAREPHCGEAWELESLPRRLLLKRLQGLTGGQVPEADERGQSAAIIFVLHEVRRRVRPVGFGHIPSQFGQ